ncbi:hypothetical protein N7509_011784 [Penicillium cosmopolitanum]|uniref:Pathway-specific nitrogen regulator n=1 Tax=Penicillium cosmopolitanum TaxID=1131564 RepID=A0A9W9SHW6_9EURO|nr:uncharacterized protein N7509_011784 [Penicillium cosmopolitanum]KAJ5378665.1 hypothetical protein N7509_011784 [Penicillium cosmopolitanum]
MARLNDESHFIPEGHRHPSDQILSPQPCAPPTKEHHLLSSYETSHHHNLHNPSDNLTDDGEMSRDYNYPSSSSPSTRNSTSDIFSQDMADNELDLSQLKSRASSRSSFSSIPASVLIHPLEKLPSMRSMNPHEKMVAAYTLEEDDEARFGGFDDHPPQRTMNMHNIRTIRQREGAFRKPSSVRAMQMHTEDEADDDEYLTPPRRRGGLRSPGSSPIKRSPYYSPTAAAKVQPKPKKEYPLVLLHCNLLAPSLPVTGASLPQNQGIVEEILPVEYWKRWRRLQEKVGSGVTRDWGVLISHPEDLYDMLEERLLESLELQRARLHQGHFLGKEERHHGGDDGDDGDGDGDGSEREDYDDYYSDREESETDGEQGDECPDCGGRVQKHSDSNRKWEIRVFAANGLMRAGAWAAAWKEMEKVDVEVGLWLPSDVRRSLEKRLTEEQAVLKEEFGSSSIYDQTQGDIDPRRLSIQSHSRTGSDPRSFQASPPAKHVPVTLPVNAQSDEHASQPQAQSRKADGPQEDTKQPQIALQTLLINYFRVLAGDRRNIALVLMSILVVFLAIGARPELPQSILHTSPSNNVAFDNAPGVMVESPVLSATSSSFSERADFTSVPAASVSASESIIASAEASLSSQVEEVAAPSLVNANETPVESEPISSETVAPAEAEEGSAVEDDISSTLTSEVEEASTSPESPPSESAPSDSPGDDPTPSSTSVPEDESIDSETASPPAATEDANLDQPEDQEESYLETQVETEQD